ncbi:MAG: phosphotransferase system cellobiose-specific component [Bacillota bacterium]|jgi:PTS system cellobiose-specific IIB component|nr:phosphotransferase system cellobiose-specific component [Bacillota bacterium]
MIRIILACAEGMSTSMLVIKMQEAAKKKGHEVEISAISEVQIKSKADEIDILLLGPQIRYLLGKMRTELGSKIPVIEVINMSDYGLMNGEKILDHVMELYFSNQNT